MPQDLTRAMLFYKVAAEQDDYSLPQYSYAHMLYYGQGLEENYEEAAQWYLKAAGQEDSLPVHYLQHRGDV